MMVVKHEYQHRVLHSVLSACILNLMALMSVVL